MHQGTNAQIRIDSNQTATELAAAPTGISWLSLGQAAAAIGVHPITLRRWADAGQIVTYRTAGGHRRFLREDVEAFLKGHRRIRQLGMIEARWAVEALRAIRRKMTFEVGAALPLDPRDRDGFRRSGRRLLALMVQVPRGQRDPESLRREARRIGGSYASWARSKGVGLREMLRGFHLVRQPMVDAALDLLEKESLEPRAVRGLLSELEESLFEVEMGLLEASLACNSSAGGAG